MGNTSVMVDDHANLPRLAKKSKKGHRHASATKQFLLLYAFLLALILPHF